MNTDRIGESGGNRYFGKYRGLVVDNIDPEHMGRLQVSVASIIGYGAWAMPCVPYAGEGVGMYLMPDVGTGVWVEFEAGDLSFPVWTGCYWLRGQLPPEAVGPSTKLLRTTSTTLLIDDGVGGVQFTVDHAG